MSRASPSKPGQPVTCINAQCRHFVTVNYFFLFEILYSLECCVRFLKLFMTKNLYFHRSPCWTRKNITSVKYKLRNEDFFVTQQLTSSVHSDGLMRLYGINLFPGVHTTLNNVQFSSSERRCRWGRRRSRVPRAFLSPLVYKQHRSVVPACTWRVFKNNFNKNSNYNDARLARPAVTCMRRALFPRLMHSDH